MLKIMQIKSLPTSRGAAWIQQGYALFMQSPQQWLLLSAINFALLWLLEQLGGLGGMLSILLSPVLIAGWLLGCHALRTGLPLKPAYFWAGFMHQTPRLLTLGGVMVVSLLVIGVMVVGLGGETISKIAEQWQPHGSPEQLSALLGEEGMNLLFELFLIILIPVAVLSMAMQFAPMLVVFNNVPPLIALKISVVAFWVNFAPLAVYGLVWSLGYFVLLELGGGELFNSLVMLVASPIIIASAYAAYREVVPDAE